MAKEKLFRSSVGGYNKDDVKRYIEEIDIAATTAREELEGKIRELESQNASFSEKLTANEAELSLLRAEKENAQALSGKVESLTEEKAALEASVVAQGEKLSQTENELLTALDENQTLKTENSSLLEKLSALEAQKSEEEENAANAVRELLEKARDEAEALVVRAKEAADKIVSDAKEKAQLDAEKAKEESNELVKTNLEKVRYLNKRKNELADIFREHKAKVDSLFSTISGTLKGEGK